MKKSLQLYFLGTLILSAYLFVQALLNPNAGIDFQEGDAYYVLSIASFYNGLGCLLLLKVAFVFFIKSKGKTENLLKFNLLVDNGLVVFLLIAKAYCFNIGGVPRRYHRFDGYQAFSNVSTSVFTYWVIGICIVYLLNQFFFISIIGMNYKKKEETEMI
jgi:hypothetical protein